MKFRIFCFILLFCFSLIFGEEPVSHRTGQKVIGKISFRIVGIASVFELRKLLELKRGDLYSEENLLKQVLIFRDHSYYQSVDWEIGKEDSDHVDIIFILTVDPGRKPLESEKTVIDRIHISGNWKTGDSVILKELLFEKGVPAGYRVLEDSIQRIRNLDFFYKLDWGLIETGTETILQILVAEKWTTFPVIYIEGDDAGTELKLGAVDLNLLGSGLFLQLDYTAIFSESPLKNNFNLDASYRNLLGSRFDFETEIGSYEEIHEISSDGTVSAGFNHKSYRALLSARYDFPGNFYPALEIEFTHNIYSGEDVNPDLQIPFDYTSGLLSPRLILAYDSLNQIDHRKNGFYCEISYSPKIVLYGEESLFHLLKVEVAFHYIFPWDRLFFKTKGLMEYSTSSRETGYKNMNDYLRGGSGNTIYDPFSAGIQLEAGITPIKRDFLTFDLKAVADLGWSGDSLYLRAGPGLNITLPFIAEFNLSFDLVWTESGIPEIYFGMLPFFR